MSVQTENSENHKLPYWIILAVLFIFSLISGIIGFRIYFIQNHEEYSWVRAAYSTMQLYVLENGERAGHIPLILNFARFTAPLTTVLALIIALFELLQRQWNHIRIALMKNHMVIIGFGSKGKNVMEDSIRRKEKVIVVDLDPFNPNLALIRPPRCRFLCGDSTHKSTLLKAGITRAKSAYLLLRDDTLQVKTCMLIYQILKVSKRSEHSPLLCVMHLQQQEFLITMRNHMLVKDKHDGMVLNIFNVYENSARELFEENPPDRTGITIQSDNFVQIVIFGLGNAGEALALQAAWTGHYINGKKPRILIIDKLAKDKVADFAGRYPSYVNYCILDYLTLDTSSPQLISAIIKKIDDPLALTTMVLCFDNKIQNLLLGLQLENIKLNNTDLSPQVFVRTNDNESFAGFSQHIKPYGLSSKVCSQEAIFEGALDSKARAIHASYLKKRKLESDFGTRATDVEWEDLSQEYRDSNRKAADHIGVKMRGIGCEVVSMDDPRPVAIFSQDEIEKMAKLEHRRWSAERSLAGWTYNKEKNEKIRQTPFLTTWDKLPAHIKGYDRDAVTDIPDVLLKVGQKAVRRS